MSAINISIVILMIIYNFLSCYADCESYYLIMEQKFGDYAYYSPINKDNITWTISNIHSNKDTHEFDMNCVLNLNCDSIHSDRPQVVFVESMNKTIIKEENTTTIDGLLIPPELLETGKHGDTKSGKYTSENSTAEDGSLGPETTTNKNITVNNEFTDIENNTKFNTTENNGEGEIVNKKKTTNTEIISKHGDTKSNTTKSNEKDEVLDKENSSVTEIIPVEGDIKSNTTKNKDDDDELVDKKKITNTEIIPKKGDTKSNTTINNDESKLDDIRKKNTEIIPEEVDTKSNTTKTNDEDELVDTNDLTNTDIIPVEGDTESNITKNNEENDLIDKKNSINSEIVPVEGDMKSNSAGDSKVNPDKHTNATDIVSGTVNINNTNSTDDRHNEIISKNGTETSSNSSDTNTTILFSKVPKYDPEKSRILASKVIAGTLGAVATVGVLILLKVGGTKLVEYCTQRGVYHLPNP